MTDGKAWTCGGESTGENATMQFLEVTAGTRRMSQVALREGGAHKLCRDGQKNDDAKEDISQMSTLTSVALK